MNLIRPLYWLDSSSTSYSDIGHARIQVQKWIRSFSLSAVARLSQVLCARDASWASGLCLSVRATSSDQRCRGKAGLGGNVWAGVVVVTVTVFASRGVTHN